MRFFSEPLTKQEIRAWRQRFGALSPAELLILARELSEVSKSKQNDREAMIGSTHFDPRLVCEVLDSKERGKGRIERVQTVWCSINRCGKCPHGPYKYLYRSNQRNGETHVQYAGRTVLDQDTISWMRQQASWDLATPYTIKVRPPNK